MKIKQIVISVILFAICSLILTFPVEAGQMGPKQIAHKWETLHKRWSRKDMRVALRVSRRDGAVFDTLVELKKNGISWKALAQTVKICEGKPNLMKEFWKYVKKYKFHPAEVAGVIRNFPPSSTHRYYYFYYRAGGSKGMNQRAGEKKNEKKNQQNIKGYSANEVLGIFIRARLDVKLIKQYFEKRKTGIPIKKAWAEIKKKVETQKAEEEEREKEKHQAQIRREEERTEKLKRLKDYKEKQEKTKQTSDEEKERVETVTAADLFGDGTDSSDKEDRQKK